MRHALGLGIVLLVVWGLLSGHTGVLLISLGVVSCALVVWLALRMDVVDREGHPVHLHWLGLARYWMWLTREIVIANLDVARRILRRTPDISPTVVRVRCSQRTDMGRVIYANSITLTPGTVSIDVSDHEVTVHALSRDGARELERGEMDRRVSALEGD